MPIIDHLCTKAIIWSCQFINNNNNNNNKWTNGIVQCAEMELIQIVVEEKHGNNNEKLFFKNIE